MMRAKALWLLLGLAQGLLVFAASTVLLLLAWGPIAAGRGGGIGPVIALDRSGGPQELKERLLEKLSLRTQLRRLLWSRHRRLWAQVFFWRSNAAGRVAGPWPPERREG